MRILLLLISLTSLSINLFAQYSNPNVQWSFSTKKIAPDQFDLVVTAKIAAGYHLYSQFIVIPEGGTGPISTAFTFEKSKDFSLVGSVKESGNRKEAVEPLFDDITLIWFEEQGVFTQRVKLKAPEVTIKGIVSFMTCNDRSCDP
ncbi:MAG TPA: protein-disulfide reductase DsbD family protein, partial [Chitinophagales bacterium]|nr:protein-disulfide reductase DsbD family protein [Chitinophagales bacterium]